VRRDVADGDRGVAHEAGRVPGIAIVPIPSGLRRTDQDDRILLDPVPVVVQDNAAPQAPPILPD
jgi:hypothetical protein